MDDKIRKDTELMGKLKECCKAFVALDTEVINNAVIMEVLRYMELAEEVES